MPVLLVTFIITTTIWAAVSLWLSARQISCVRHHRDSVPADFAASVTLEEHRKAADYTVARERLSNVSAIWDLAISFAWVLGGFNLLYGALAFVLPPSLVLGVTFLIATAAVGALLSLPFDIYKTFVLEQKFGFNRTTFR